MAKHIFKGKKYYLYAFVTDKKDCLEFKTKKKCNFCNVITNFDEAMPFEKGFQFLLQDLLEELKDKRNVKKNKTAKKVGKGN